jgi:hypothetical protein
VHLLAERGRARVRARRGRRLALHGSLSGAGAAEGGRLARGGLRASAACPKAGSSCATNPASTSRTRSPRWAIRSEYAIAYHLAVVVDDAAAGITLIVRGRDLAASTATHVLLQRALGAPTPIYRHHFLLLEASGEKLAKLHGAVGFRELASGYSGEAFCGLLAELAGLRPDASPTTPARAARRLRLGRVRRDDMVLRWTAERSSRYDARHGPFKDRVAVITGGAGGSARAWGARSLRAARRSCSRTSTRRTSRW